MVLLWLCILVPMGYLFLQWWTVKKGEPKRCKALQTWAEQRGWTYWDRDDYIPTTFDGPMFATGHANVATNVLKGTWGKRKAMVFDYEYKLANDRNTNHAQIFMVAMPCAVGVLVVKPERLSAKLKNELGFADVQLENEAFNRAYRLIASSQGLAYDLMPARNIELLLNHSETHLSTEGAMLVSADYGRLDASKLDGPLELLNAFIDNVPPFVWKDHRAPRRTGHSTDETPAAPPSI